MIVVEYTYEAFKYKGDLMQKILLICFIFILPLWGAYNESNQSMNCYEIIQEIQVLKDNRRMNGGLTVALFF